ncbi:UDP-glucuronic acid decarboxylase 6-like protein, partial [Tanacetum coccineum]
MKDHNEILYSGKKKWVNKLNMITATVTSKVYGDPLVYPQDESYWVNVNPIGIRTCYDEGTRVAETLMFDYHRQHGIEIHIARISDTYGPRINIDDGRVVSKFHSLSNLVTCYTYRSSFYNHPLHPVYQMFNKSAITVQSPGTQTRSYCYVSDMADGLIRLIKGSNTGAINIGNP